MSNLSFKILHKDKKTKARIGKLKTTHGEVDTPAFVAVGTQATVKSLTPADLEAIGVQILFGNTYHLHLRPGEETVEAFGGLNKFMNYKGVTMTDSGGFQVFSLARNKFRGLAIKGAEVGEKFSRSASEMHTVPSNGHDANFENFPSSPRQEELAAKLVKITENGVEFRSHLDGSKHFFTPEKSIEIQKKLGADILLSFDDCPPFPVTYEGAKGAMERTHRWAERSLAEFKKSKGNLPQSLYGIVQGSVFKDLREESAKFIGNMDFDGIAIGGVAVGEGKKEMTDAVDWAMPFLPEEKIRHLLGVGDVDDIFAIIERGIDTFDCVTPTRLGRVGQVFVGASEGNLKNRFRLDITKSAYAKSKEPLSKNCSCYSCQHFTRGYIHHLFKAQELLGYRLATYHNLHFIVDLVRQIREAIQNDQLEALKASWLS